MHQPLGQLHVQCNLDLLSVVFVVVYRNAFDLEWCIELFKIKLSYLILSSLSNSKPCLTGFLDIPIYCMLNICLASAFKWVQLLINRHELLFSLIGPLFSICPRSILYNSLTDLAVFCIEYRESSLIAIVPNCLVCII